MNPLLKSAMSFAESMEGTAMKSWLGTAGAGAAVGGATSWLTGGSVSQGAFTGAAMGIGIRGGLGQLHANAGYSAGVGQMAAAFANTESRRAAVLGGAALGGLAFGGNRSLASGFNAQRGNRITH